MPKVSIITLCYNQLENATKPFIESLYKYTDIQQFELIIIDNGSCNDTLEYLNSISYKYKNIVVIRNNENLGYAKGNNQGLKIAQGEYLFLCNNDLLFSPNWLDKCIKTFENHKDIGLLSVMTNFCGNPNQVVKNAKQYNVDNYLQMFSDNLDNNEIAYQDKIIFFCVGLTRATFETVGYFDENFGYAWFEDDDYSLRCLYNGYKLAIVKNVFIFHNHSQTSSKLYDTQEGKLLQKNNQKYFEEKHKFYLDLKRQVYELQEKLNKKWYRLIFSIENKYQNNKKIKYITLFGLKIKIRCKN